MPFDSFDRHLDAAEIQALLEGELGDSESAFQAHVEGCARCRSEVAAWTTLLNHLEDLTNHAPAPGFSARVMARTRVAHLTPQRLQDYLDGLLPQAVATGVERHIGSCSVCRGEADAWGGLFKTLEVLPRLEPAAAFADRVLDRITPEPRLGLAARMGRRLGLVRSPGKEMPSHLTPERLQDFLEGLLSRPQMARIESHLEGCHGCRQEAEAWSNLWLGLQEIPRLEPAEGFGDRVMARIKPRQETALAPAARVGLSTLVSKLLPSSRRSWALASTLAMAPATAMTILGVYLFTRPQVTPTSLMLYLWWKVSAGMSAAVGWAGDAFTGLPMVAQAQEFFLALASTPSVLVGTALAFSAMTLMAVWVLYRNLISPPLERRKYASISL